MIEIVAEPETITIDITEFITDHKWLRSGDEIKCNIYFAKFECKFTSKDVVISYDTLKQFNSDLKQFLNNQKDYCLLVDQHQVISLEFKIDEHKVNPLVDYNMYLLEFKLFYYAGSNLMLTGRLSVEKDTLENLLEEIDFLL